MAKKETPEVVKISHACRNYRLDLATGKAETSHDTSPHDWKPISLSSMSVPSKVLAGLAAARERLEEAQRV